MEGLKVTDSNLVVSIHPSKARNIADSLYRELSSLLFKFNETFDGILLAYGVKFPSNLAKILPGIHPYFGARLEAKKHGEEAFRSTACKKHKIRVGTIVR